MNVIWLSAPADREPMHYRIFPGPWGEMLAIWHGETLCRLGFIDSARQGDQVLAESAAYWGAEAIGMTADDARYQVLEKTVRSWPEKPTGHSPVLEVVGTDFQQRVWRLLLTSHAGQFWSYGDIASRIGSPRAARAVGQALAANPIALLIPCHRVLPSGGGLGSYRWGAYRKEGLLAAEGVRTL